MKLHRSKTKQLHIKNLLLGGQAKKVVIQSMLTCKTSNIEEAINQINKLTTVGCELIRVSILDENDAKSINEIKQHITIPIVADIHFSAKLALSAIENGADKIRINPGNFTNKKDLVKIIKLAKENNVVIRIGINTGSLNEKDPKLIVKKMLEEIKFFEKHNFTNLVLSIKSSNSLITQQANLLLAKKTKYPIHLGLTEGGDLQRSLIKSCFCLKPLLDQGIGDTIRISLPGDPLNEISACKTILKECGLLSNEPDLISCPTCGRLACDTSTILAQVKQLLETIHKDVKVAVMGCIVNGVGEARDADIAIFPINDHTFVIYKDGQPYSKVTGVKQALTVIQELIDNYK